MKGMANDERGYLLTGDSEFLGEIADRAKKIDGELADAGKAAPEADDIETVERISAKFGTWAKALDAEFAQYKTDPKGATKVALGANRDLRKAYEETVKAAIADSTGDLDRSLADVKADAGATRTALLGALLAMIVLAAAGCFWLERRTRRRLDPLVARLRSLDEHCVKGLDDGLRAMASGDLTVEVVPATTDGARRTEDGVATVLRTREAFEAIGAAIEDMSARVGEIAGAVHSISAEAQRAENDVSEVANVAEQSSASVQQVTASTQEISASAEALASTADELNVLVQRFTVSS